MTWYDDATGERIELSVTTAANWAAKTANLLAEDDVTSVRLDPPAHWLTVVATLGAWVAGLPLDEGGEVLPGDPAEFMRTVLPQPDALLVPPATPAEVEDPGVAAPPGARVLSTLPLTSAEGLTAALLVPLAARGSVVLVANADAGKLASRAATERATHTAGCDVAGLPRLL